jgi:hypothetical protein
MLYQGDLPLLLIIITASGRRKTENQYSGKKSGDYDDVRGLSPKRLKSMSHGNQLMSDKKADKGYEKTYPPYARKFRYLYHRKDLIESVAEITVGVGQEPLGSKVFVCHPDNCLHDI